MEKGTVPVQPLRAGLPGEGCPPPLPLPQRGRGRGARGEGEGASYTTTGLIPLDNPLTLCYIVYNL